MQYLLLHLFEPTTVPGVIKSVVNNTDSTPRNCWEASIVLAASAAVIKGAAISQPDCSGALSCPAFHAVSIFGQGGCIGSQMLGVLTLVVRSTKP